MGLRNMQSCLFSKVGSYYVNIVRPKNGQKMAFEAAYKVHIAKFHKTVEKIYVYEILSGPD